MNGGFVDSKMAVDRQSAMGVRARQMAQMNWVFEIETAVEVIALLTDQQHRGERDASRGAPGQLK